MSAASPVSDPALPLALLLGAAAFGVAVLLGRWLVPYLRRAKIGKRIREEEPESNLAKAGTPTMGGSIIIGAATLVSAAGLVWWAPTLLLPLAVMLAAAAMGAVDDSQTLVGKKGQGLSARAKMALQIAIATAAALVLYGPLGVHGVVVPGLGQLDVGLLVVPVAVLFIVAFSNAVNLTDGLDTLAAGVAAVAFTAYGIIAYMVGQPALLGLCLVLVGALLGFLWFNAHPAQVFMGDTGSLALGAVLAVVAFQTGHWLVLPVIGIIFVVEALSVMLQVAYFKRTGGRRVFRMSPIHYHFLLGGWAETQVTLRFWLVAIVAALIGLALALS